MAIITKSDPEDLSLSTTGAWTDCDASTISGYTASVTGVIVRVINTGSSNWTWGLRKNGSTDDRRASAIVGNTPGTHLMMAVGVDTSGIFEGWIQSTDVDFEIVAFITGDTFFTNMVDKSTGTTSAWVDFNISSDTGGDTATWAWVEWNIVGASAMGLRCNGSTDDRRALSWRKNAGGCKVDGSEIGEQYIASTGSDLFLAGYGTAASSQITAHTNAIDRSTATTGSYETITSPDASAIAAFYDVYTTTATAGSFSIRRTGSSADSYRDLYLRAHWAVTLSATGGTAEQKIESTDVDVFELMYWTSGGAANYSLSLDATSVALTAQAVTTRAARRLALDHGTFALTAQDATTRAARRLAVDQASVSLSAQDITTRAARHLGVDPAGVTLSAQDLGLRAAYRLGLDPASLSLALQDVTLSYSEEGGYTLALDPASVAVTAQALGLTAARHLVAEAAVVTVTAEALGLSATRLISLGEAQIALTGQALGLLVGRVVSLDPVATAVTMQALTVRADRTVSLSPASIALTMGDLVFDDSGALIGIIALDGSFVPVVALTGSAVSALSLSGDVPG